MMERLFFVVRCWVSRLRKKTDPLVKARAEVANFIMAVEGTHEMARLRLDSLQKQYEALIMRHTADEGELRT